MNLAICLFKYFRYGGLARDFLNITNVCLERGHTVTVYAMEWHEDIPEYLTVNILEAKHWQNHSRTKIFINKLENELSRNNFDCVIGFNKMPGLDIYYAADVCYLDKAQGFSRILYRLGGRYKYYSFCEKSVFSIKSKTVSLMISKNQMKLFKKFYQTPDERMLLLPPGISKDRIATENSNEIRAKFRKDHSIADDDKILLMIGSGFKTKGLDRSLKAIALLTEPVKNKLNLFVVGEDNIKAFEKMAEKLSVAENVRFFGGRNDIPAFLLGADLLLQPSYRESAGAVIIEAIVSGLPVLASDICGYGFHVEQAGAGKLIPSPFSIYEFSKLIEEMLSSPERESWKSNGLKYARTEDLYSMPEQAVNYIEEIMARKKNVSVN